jgi:hypothetical protein
VHFTVPAQNRQQAGLQDVVGLGSDVLAVRRHVLRPIGSDYRPCVHLFRQMQPPFVRLHPPFVAFPRSALRRAAILARMVRDARVARFAEFSPQSSARICGVLYLLIIAAGLFAQFVRQRLVMPRDAAATAANITDHALMFRLGLTADLSTFVCAVALTVILYVLLKPVNRNAALLIFGFNVVQDAIGGLNVLNTYRPLQLLGDAAYLQVFNREQLEAMALLSLNTHSVGFAVAMIFFGCSCVALGYLTFTSGLLPRALGVLMAIAGFSYLTLSGARLLSPPLASILFPSILVPAFIGELSFAVWLTVKGVNLARWREMTERSASALL